MNFLFRNGIEDIIATARASAEMFWFIAYEDWILEC